MDKIKNNKYKGNYVDAECITICINGGCPMRDKCYRFNIASNNPNQTYVKYEPLDDSEDNFECEKFIPLKT